MKKGDIVLVSFPFTDFSGVKNRPAVVLISEASDVTLAFLTTKISDKNSTDIHLPPSAENGLKKESLIRLNKIVTLSKGLILGRLGRLTGEEIKLIDKNLAILFQL